VDTKLITIMDNYINMVKFTRKSNEFKKIASYLKLIVDKALEKVQKN
jgi:hypothetical protein